MKMKDSHQTLFSTQNVYAADRSHASDMDSLLPKYQVCHFRNLPRKLCQLSITPILAGPKEQGTGDRATSSSLLETYHEQNTIVKYHLPLLSAVDDANAAKLLLFHL